ncbi:MAG: metallophosphoesterase [Deltaproteobacteria bacterium]|nr:metallophosphoesterase [Deltaproteobacteria bacterium]
MSPYRNFKRFISEQLDTVLRLPQAVIVGLNSTAPYTRIVNGAIATEQLALCKAAFESGQAGVARIVVMHHHLVPTPDFEKSEYIANARPILSQLSRLGVDLVLGGHAHRSYVGSSLDTYPAREPEKGIVIVQCGTSTSRRGRGRERDRNSCNLIEIDERTIHVRHY